MGQRMLDVLTVTARLLSISIFLVMSCQQKTEMFPQLTEFTETCKAGRVAGSVTFLKNNSTQQMHLSLVNEDSIESLSQGKQIGRGDNPKVTKKGKDICCKLYENTRDSVCIEWDNAKQGIENPRHPEEEDDHHIQIPSHSR